TTFLNLADFIPPKYAVFPLNSGKDNRATAPVCANASTFNTPGITGLPGKCPLNNSSLIVTFLLATAFSLESILLLCQLTTWDSDAELFSLFQLYLALN